MADDLNVCQVCVNVCRCLQELKTCCTDEEMQANRNVASNVTDHLKVFLSHLVNVTGHLKVFLFHLENVTGHLKVFLFHLENVTDHLNVCQYGRQNQFIALQAT